MQDLIDDIIVWQRQTFNEVDFKGAMRHLGEELIEYLAAKSPVTLMYEGDKLLEVMNQKLNKEIESDKERNIADELADMQFMLIQLADLEGLNLADITRAKMEKNKMRRWSLEESTGIARHVEDSE